MRFPGVVGCLMVGSLGGGFNYFSCSSLLVGMIYINLLNIFRLTWNHHLGSLTLGEKLGHWGGLRSGKKRHVGVCWGGFKIQKRLCLFHLSLFVVVGGGQFSLGILLFFLKRINQKKVLQMPFSRGYLDPSLPKKSKTFGLSNENTLVGWVI